MDSVGSEAEVVVGVSKGDIKARTEFVSQIFGVAT